MNLNERFRPENPQVNLIWRFYSDSARLWKWQRIAFDGTVIEHSKSAYSQYEACLANASEHGYESFPSLSSKASGMSSKAKPSNIRLTAGQQKIVSAIATGTLEQKEEIPMDDSLNGD